MPLSCNHKNVFLVYCICVFLSIIACIVCSIPYSDNAYGICNNTAEWVVSGIFTSLFCSGFVYGYCCQPSRDSVVFPTSNPDTNYNTLTNDNF